MASLGSNVFWALRGFSFRNPPRPASVRLAVFVCHANLCRSPFAEHWARRVCADRGLSGVEFDSAGLNVQRSTPPSDAVRAAAQYGIDLASHRAVALTPERAEAAQLIIGMEPRHIVEMRRRFPHLRDRLFLLSLFTERPVDGGAFDRYHLADPYGRGAEAFDHCYSRIGAAVEALADWLYE